MRILGSVIRTLVLDVLNARHQLFHCDTVTAEPVSDDSTRQRALHSQNLSKEPLCGSRITVALHENVDSFSLLVDGSPKILIAAIDLEAHLIQMPGIAHRASELFQALRILGAKLLALCPNRFVAHGDTALEHHFLNIAIAQAVPKIEPHTATDDLNRVTMAMIVPGKIHAIIRSHLVQLDNAAGVRTPQPLTIA